MSLMNSDIEVKIRHAKRQNAQNLDLSNMQLEILPVSLFSLKNVLNLNLSNNKLKEVDIMIENMVNLTELNLENNNIETLPQEMLNLANLTKVNLNNNPVMNKLKDYKYNWKASVRDYLKGGSSDNNSIGGVMLGLGTGSNLRSSSNIYKKEEVDSTFTLKQQETKQESKKPFNFNMNNMKLSNTLTNFNLKKRDSNASMGGEKNNAKDGLSVNEIPKCNIFEHPSSGGGKNLSNNSEINSTSQNNPVKIGTSQLNKKAALDSLIKKKPQTAHDTGLAHKRPYQSQEGEIKEMKEKLNTYEQEINNMKQSKEKVETEYKAKIKKLEDELRNLKINNPSVNTTTVTNKRNWKENNDIGVANTNSNPLGLGLNPTSNFTMRSTLEDNFEGKVKDLESQLQKEVQTNKRLKNEIDRLTQHVNSNKTNFSAENMLKNVQEINYEEIEMSDKIGQGGFSVIYKGMWNLLPVAVKLIFDPNVTEELLNEFNNEIKMLYLLRHPNIILLLGISTKPQKLAIVTEYVENGSLFDLLHRSNKEVTYQTKVKIISQLIRTLAYVHQNGIVHRDIKSHNVLMDENLNVKMCDFGLATYKSDLKWGSGQFAGTPAYMAPELYMKKAYDEKIDIFAFGTLMWEILVRKIPYEGIEVFEIKNKILSQEQLYIPKTVPAEFGNIINSCRLTDPSKRPTFSELSKINIYAIK